jgi:hypothetical protein
MKTVRFCGNCLHWEQHCLDGNNYVIGHCKKYNNKKGASHPICWRWEDKNTMGLPSEFTQEQNSANT